MAEPSIPPGAACGLPPVAEPAAPPDVPPGTAWDLPPMAEPAVPPGLPDAEPAVPLVAEPEVPPGPAWVFPVGAEPAAPPGVESDFAPVGESALPSAESAVPAAVASGSACGVLSAADLSPGSGTGPGARGSGSLGAQPAGLFRFGCGSSLIVLPCSCFASYVHFRTASYALRPLRASFAPLAKDSRTGRSVPGSRHAPRTPPCAPSALSVPSENPWHTDPAAE